MNKSLNAELIQEIAVELGVDPSFIEKDWYAVQVLRLISEHTIEGITPIFTGGTSLSKGYGLIERFSEDIDFQILSDTPLSRSDRRAYRQSIIGLVNSYDGLSVDEASIKSRDSGNFFSFNISYPQIYKPDASLRTTLQLEMSFKEKPLPVEGCAIQSFVAAFTESAPETHIECLTPERTAADKFSALLWRITARDRTQELGSPQNDPTIVRHLHDLSALESMALAHEQFVPMVHASFEADNGRGGTDPDASLADRIQKVQSILSSEDRAYRSEYTQYVAAMSYAPDEQKIDFDRAQESLSRIIAAIMNS